ncbi:hypothetical protein C8F04DRAFT_1188556 [Mycena alexandri]|uniref:Uncharacterized protein n=1 Tax=Mycena alexandri TaxID=1745969 RepID=A0AAD6SJ94_9AGAR|nr:hypothetical protein C8F04DRAFT_1188556 [Mycena alexandri]
MGKSVWNGVNRALRDNFTKCAEFVISVRQLASNWSGEVAGWPMRPRRPRSAYFAPLQEKNGFLGQILVGDRVKEAAKGEVKQAAEGEFHRVQQQIFATKIRPLLRVVTGGLVEPRLRTAEFIMPSRRRQWGLTYRTWEVDILVPKTGRPTEIFARLQGGYWEDAQERKTKQGARRQGSIYWVGVRFGKMWRQGEGATRGWELLPS